MPFDEKLQKLIDGITDPTAKAAITTLFATTPELAAMYTTAKGVRDI